MISIAIREMHTQTTMRYHLTEVRMANHQKNLQKINTGESMEKLEPSCKADGNVKWYSHYGK